MLERMAAARGVRLNNGVLAPNIGLLVSEATQGIRDTLRTVLAARSNFLVGIVGDTQAAANEISVGTVINSAISEGHIQRNRVSEHSLPLKRADHPGLSLHLRAGTDSSRSPKSI